MDRIQPLDYLSQGAGAAFEAINGQEPAWRHEGARQMFRIGGLAGLTLVGAALASVPATAQTWDGETSVNWFTATNWSGNTIPTAGSTVTINDGSLVNQPVLNENPVSVDEVALSAGSLRLGAGSALRALNGIQVSGTGILIGKGATIVGDLSIGGGMVTGDLDVVGGLNVTAGSVSGSRNISGNFTLGGGSVLGSSAVTGDLTVNGGTLAGSQTVTGDFSGTGGIIALSLLSPASFDTLAIGGTAGFFAGLLRIDLSAYEGTRNLSVDLVSFAGREPHTFGPDRIEIVGRGILRPTVDTTETGVRLLIPQIVPEPRSWALLIVGFGAVGLALRSRRAAQAMAI